MTLRSTCTSTWSSGSAVHVVLLMGVFALNVRQGHLATITAGEVYSCEVNGTVLVECTKDVIDGNPAALLLASKGLRTIEVGAFVLLQNVSELTYMYVLINEILAFFSVSLRVVVLVCMV
eukprot:m.150861 g.150861  ORF g.150861 m.150861 type:complete len:120 (+) comp30746_c1_seq3:61-420(+)